MTAPGIEIICAACGADSFVKREPIYEGFERVGECISCADCGHVYEDHEDIPYKEARAPKVFTEADRSRNIEIFTSDERDRNCRHCRHYVLNPFVQRCGLHKRDVEATYSCPDFAPSESGDNNDPLDALLKKS